MEEAVYMFEGKMKLIVKCWCINEPALVLAYISRNLIGLG